MEATTKQERYESYLHMPGTKMAMCANCEHYIAHYSKTGWDFGCGHCVQPRLKPRNAYDICEHFESKYNSKGSLGIIRRESR